MNSGNGSDELVEFVSIELLGIRVMEDPGKAPKPQVRFSVVRCPELDCAVSFEGLGSAAESVGRSSGGISCSSSVGRDFDCELLMRACSRKSIRCFMPSFQLFSQSAQV